MDLFFRTTFEELLSFVKRKSRDCETLITLSQTCKRLYYICTQDIEATQILLKSSKFREKGVLTVKFLQKCFLKESFVEVHKFYLRIFLLFVPILYKELR